MKNKTKNQRGFALLTAIIITGMLLLVSFVVADLAYKELILTSTGQQSQIAFYMADSGAECALYWDLKDPSNPSISSFATSTAGNVICNNQTVTTGNPATVPTVPPTPTVVGGGGVSNPVSTFSINFANSCAIVQVTKNADGTTKIDSRGYNTCDTSVARRFERGITITY